MRLFLGGVRRVRVAEVKLHDGQEVILNQLVPRNYAAHQLLDLELSRTFPVILFRLFQQLPQRLVGLPGQVADVARRATTSLHVEVEHA